MTTTENEPGAGTTTRRLTHGELLELRRWNTPTISAAETHSSSSWSRGAPPSWRGMASTVSSEGANPASRTRPRARAESSSVSGDTSCSDTSNAGRAVAALTS